MPFSSPSLAALRAALTALASVVFSLMKVRSTMETLGVGTRMAKPSSLPEVSGMTSLRALAAPVELGIMLSYGVREDLSVDRLTCRMPPMGVFRQCKRACALQVAGKALSSQGPDFTRSHNQIWSNTPLRLKKNFDADNSRCC